MHPIVETAGRFRRTLAAVLVAGTALALGACSLATVAYNNAPTLLGYALADYVTLTPEQDELVRARIARFIAWHRANELPAWRRLLDEARDRVAAGPDEAQVREVLAKAQALFERTAERMVDDVADLLPRLDADQVAQLAAKLRKDNARVEKELSTPTARRRADRAEQMTTRFEDWLGALTPEQAEYLRARMALYAPLDAQRLADRRGWQKDFFALLDAKPAPATMRTTLRMLVLAPEKRRDPAYNAARARQTEEMTATIAWMIAHATPAQRERVRSKLGSYAELVATLVGDA